MSEILYSIPDILDGKVNISSPYRNYNSRGNPTSYGIDMSFPEMFLTKNIKSSDYHLIGGKIEDTLRSWETKYQRHLEVQHKKYCAELKAQHKKHRAEFVEELNRQAKEALESLGNILHHTLSVNDAVDWNAVKRKDSFRIKPENMFKDGQRPDFIQFNNDGRLLKLEEMKPLDEPTYEQIREKYGLLTKLFRKKLISDAYAQQYSQWKTEIEKAKKENIFREKWFKKVVDFYEAKKLAFEDEKTKTMTHWKILSDAIRNLIPRRLKNIVTLF